MEQLDFLKAFAQERGLLYKRDSPYPGVSDCYVYSPDEFHRYAFARLWDSAGPLVLWVGINPGKGDTENTHRPTLRRCVDRSRRWGAAGIMFGNLFAARHNQPRALRTMEEPIGEHNDDALAAMSKVAWKTVVAWGREGNLLDRSEKVAARLVDPHCLGVTKSGQPRHPLYVANDIEMVPWPVPFMGPY